MQDFIVTWVDRLDNDRFRVFDSLAEAEKFMDEVAESLVDSYIYLAIVIKKQQLYRVHWYTVGTIKPTKQQHRGIQDDSTRRGTNCNTGFRGIPLDES